MSNLSPPLDLKTLCDFSHRSDLSGRPGDRVGPSCPGKTPTHPGNGDPAWGVWGEQFVLWSVQVKLAQVLYLQQPCAIRRADTCPGKTQKYLGRDNN